MFPQNHMFIKFDTWYDTHEDSLHRIYYKVLDVLKHNTEKYYPITSVQIEEDYLFTRLVNYVYQTSNNKYKRGAMRNMGDY